MKRVKRINVISWYEKCRNEVNKLPETLANLTLEEKLAFIRSQYVTLSQIDKIFKGEAFFVGYPRSLISKPVENNDS